MTPAHTVSGVRLRKKERKDAKGSFPIAGLSARVLAQYSGILQKVCRKKQHFRIIQEGGKEEGIVSACSLLSPLPEPRSVPHRAQLLNSQVVPSECFVTTQEVDFMLCGVAVSFKARSGKSLEHC